MRYNWWYDHPPACTCVDCSRRRRRKRFRLRFNWLRLWQCFIIPTMLVMFISTISMVAPGFVVKYVPKELEFLRILPTHLDLKTAEITIFELVNEERRKEGLPPLKWDERIAEYSRKHSQSMVRVGTLYHNEAKLAILRLGENAAMNYRFAGGFVLPPYPLGLAFYKTDEGLLSETVEAWMGSAGHRMNILNPDYRYTGVGIAVAEDGVTFYFTQNFR